MELQSIYKIKMSRLGMDEEDKVVMGIEVIFE